jgi:hypothetical protein
MAALRDQIGGIRPRDEKTANQLALGLRGRILEVAGGTGDRRV